MQVTETLSAGLKREYKVVVNQAELDQELNAKLEDIKKLPAVFKKNGTVTAGNTHRNKKHMANQDKPTFKY